MSDRKQPPPIQDPSCVTPRIGSSYPEAFKRECAKRQKRALGDELGLNDFGVNLVTLPPGPVPWTSDKSMPRWLASRRAMGEARTKRLADAGGSGATGSGSGSTSGSGAISGSGADTTSGVEGPFMASIACPSGAVA